MSNRKEEILIVALHLFARDGYEAVSVSQIAGELDMTKGALYRHYKSKRDIFDCIVQRMEQQDGEQATEYDMPEEDKEKMPEKYETVSVDDFVEYSKSMFEYWTEDDFASSFRKMLTIEQSEYRKVENLVRDSFWNVYRPGCLEHYVLHQLRNDPAFVPELDFVMYQDGELIGQNIFVRTVITADDRRSIPIMTMGPICIKNEYKRKGYGKILLDYSLEKAAELGCGALCFEGNIDFYGKSGFKQASEYGIRYHGLPEGEDASFFLCKELIQGYFDGITGEYATPEGYLVDEQEAEEFDKQFPYKAKKKLPRQIF